MPCKGGVPVPGSGVQVPRVGGSRYPGGVHVLPGLGGAAPTSGCGARPGQAGGGPAVPEALAGAVPALPGGGPSPGVPPGSGVPPERGAPPPHPPAPCRFRGAAGRGQPGSRPTWPGPRQPMRAPVSERSPYMAMFSAEEAGLSAPGYKSAGLAAVRSHSAGGSGSGGTVTAAPSEATSPPPSRYSTAPHRGPAAPFPAFPGGVGGRLVPRSLPPGPAVG